MIPGFEAIVEERIKKAQKQGQFDNLPGKSKPLTFENHTGPEELRMANKILKNAGFLPPEIELKKKITQTEQLLEAANIDQPEYAKLQKRLNYLITKLDTARQQRTTAGLLKTGYKKAILKKLL